MQTILIDAGARRWTLRVVLVGLLAAAIVALAATADAQDHPKPPHWFWGHGADAYVGAAVTAIDDNGDDVGSGVVGADGRWSLTVQPEDASRAKLRISTTNETRETDLMDVLPGGFDIAGLSITDFDLVDSAMIEDDSETLTLQIRARVYPSSEDPRIPFRSIEFNLRVNGVDQELNDQPTQRTIRPNHASGRWYSSNLFDLGDGFEARIIACKQPDGGVRFGVRVSGRDDIIPRLNLLPASRTSTNWASSNEVDIQKPSEDTNVSRAGRGDTNCRYGK